MNKIKSKIKWFASLWPFIEKEEFFKILFSFVVVGLIGSYLNSSFQNKSWERQVRYELLKNELEDNNKTILELTSLTEQRLFSAKQFIWAVKDNKPKIAEESWVNYMESVNKWNINSTVLQTKLAQMSGYETAAELLTYTDDLNNEIPNSIHYKFVKLHQNLLSLRECYYSGCNQQAILMKLDRYIDTLTEQQTKLIGKLNDLTIKKYNSLKLSPSNYLKTEK